MSALVIITILAAIWVLASVAFCVVLVLATRKPMPPPGPDGVRARDVTVPEWAQVEPKSEKPTVSALAGSLATSPR